MHKPQSTTQKMDRWSNGAQQWSVHNERISKRKSKMETTCCQYRQASKLDPVSHSMTYSASSWLRHSTVYSSSAVSTGFTRLRATIARNPFLCTTPRPTENYRRTRCLDLRTDSRAAEWWLQKCATGDVRLTFSPLQQLLSMERLLFLVQIV